MNLEKQPNDLGFFDGLLKKFGFRRTLEYELRRTAFDGRALEEHKITMDDIAAVRGYVMHLQGHLGRQSLWHATILRGGENGTRALIHETVEMRDLKIKGINLLEHPPAEASRILAQNKDSHKKALKAEYDYWSDRHRGGDVRQFLGTLSPEDQDMFLGSG